MEVQLQCYGTAKGIYNSTSKQIVSEATHREEEWIPLSVLVGDHPPSKEALAPTQHTGGTKGYNIPPSLWALLEEHPHNRVNRPLPLPPTDPPIVAWGPWENPHYELVAPDPDLPPPAIPDPEYPVLQCMIERNVKFIDKAGSW